MTTTIPRKTTTPWLRALGSALSFVLLLALPGAAAKAEARSQPLLDEAQRHLDLERPHEALRILEQVLSRGRPSAEALLLRSTGRIMLADVEGGYEDLQRALEIDPGLRQAWLNLAGLEIAEGRYREAYDALLKARELDPDAIDNELNLGAVLMMQGEVEPARRHFEAYLEREGGSGEAHYLVASNYALAGRQELAVEHLRRAVERDERLRLRARSDDRFITLDHPGFQELITTDVYVPPPGAHTRAAAFQVPYDADEKRLLYAVLEALRELRVPYEPAIEVTPGWALVWADLRIKVHNQSNGTGVVSLSAPADRFTAGEWERRADELFRAVYQQLGG